MPTNTKNNGSRALGTGQDRQRQNEDLRQRDDDRARRNGRTETRSTRGQA